MATPVAADRLSQTSFACVLMSKPVNLLIDIPPAMRDVDRTMPVVHNQSLDARLKRLMPPDLILGLDRTAALLFGGRNLPLRFGPFAESCFMDIGNRPAFTYASLMDPCGSPPLTTLHPVIVSAQVQALRLKQQMGRPIDELTGDLEYILVPEYRDIRSRDVRRFSVQVYFRVFALKSVFERLSCTQRCNELATVLACPWFGIDPYHRANCFSSYQRWYRWPLTEADMYGNLQVRPLDSRRIFPSTPDNLTAEQRVTYKDIEAVDDDQQALSGIHSIATVTRVKNTAICALRCMPAIVVGPVPVWNGFFVVQPSGYGKRVLLLTLVKEKRSPETVTLVVCRDKSDLTRWVNCATQDVPGDIEISLGMPASDVTDYDLVFVTYADVVSSFPAGALHTTHWHRVFFSNSEELVPTGREKACRALDARLRVAVTNRPLRYGYRGVAIQLRVLMGDQTIDILQPIVDHFEDARFSKGLYHAPHRNDTYTMGTLALLFRNNGYVDTGLEVTAELVPVQAMAEWYDDHSWLATLLSLRQQKVASVSTEKGYTRYIEKTSAHRDLLIHLCATGRMTERLPPLSVPGRRRPIADDVEVELELEAGATCAICLDALRVPVTPPCRHVFCQDCLSRVKPIFAHGPTACPHCRAGFERSQVQLVKRSVQDTKAKRKKDGAAHDRTGKVRAASKDIVEALSVSAGAKVLVLAENESLLTEAYEAIGRLSPDTARALWTRYTETTPELVDAQRVIFSPFTDQARDLRAVSSVFMLDIPIDGIGTRSAISSVVRFGQTSNVSIRAYVIANSTEHTVAKKGIVRPDVHGFRLSWSKWSSMASNGSVFWDT